MFPECVTQPRAERISLPSRVRTEVRLARKQALGRSQPDKILRRFDLPFEMLVLSADMPYCLLRVCACPLRMKVASAGLDSMEKKAIVCSSDSAA